MLYKYRPSSEGCVVFMVLLGPLYDFVFVCAAFTTCLCHLWCSYHTRLSCRLWECSLLCMCRRWWAAVGAVWLSSASLEGKVIILPDLWLLMCSHSSKGDPPSLGTPRWQLLLAPSFIYRVWLLQFWSLKATKYSSVHTISLTSWEIWRITDLKHRRVTSVRLRILT